MNSTEFEAFIASANGELQQKQNALRDIHGFGNFARWWFDQEIEKLQFFNDDENLSLEAEIIYVGSYSPQSNSWKWAWGNESVSPSLRQKAVKLKELEDITGIHMFGRDDAFEIDGKPMAWEFTAMAVKHLGALGCYMLPSSSNEPDSFLAITSVRKAIRNAP